MFDEKSYSLKMDKAIEVFSKELSSLRTGRANASMLDLIHGVKWLRRDIKRKIQ